jgi:hypothetical protein
VRAASATLILALILGLFGTVPGVFVAAQGVGEPSSFPGEAAAMEPDEAFVRSVVLTGQSLVGYAAAGPCSAPLCTLSMGPTEAEAYARNLAQTGQGSVGLAAENEPSSFPSERAAIDYYVAKARASWQGVGEPSSFASQAAAIEYFVAQNSLPQSINANSICSRLDSVLGANPELAYVRRFQNC